jgi:hypothetical protein
MVRAIGLGLMIVATDAFITWAGFRVYWVEFGLLVVSIVGIGALVGRADKDQPFIKASSVSLATLLCIESLAYIQMIASPASAQPEVLPPLGTMVFLLLMFSLMLAGVAGAVALGIRSLRDRTGSVGN